jgi:hypothetical protein
MRSDSLQHIRSLGITEECAQERIAALNVACSLVEVYGTHASLDGSIALSVAKGKERKLSDQILFDMFVPPFPISVSDGECDVTIPEIYGHSEHS